MKLLVVTDSDWVENQVKAVLPRGWVPVRLDDPHRVTEVLSAEAPAAVVVDLQVGNMGGMAVVRRLREAMAMEEVPKARLMMLLDREADRFLARRAGADHAVVKPFEAAEFRAGLPVAGLADSAPG